MQIQIQILMFLWHRDRDSDLSEPGLATATRATLLTAAPVVCPIELDKARQTKPSKPS
nr:hypothetical protein Q903MT_gene907 [Picea sitchensis]